MIASARRAPPGRRHVTVALTFAAVVVGYTDRVNISVAAVAMKEQLGWTQTQKGLVLSSFFIGYLLFMFPSGWLSARFGGKVVLGASILAWSLLTLVTPLAAAWSMPALLAARVGMGLGEAGMFPAAYELFGRWVPATERARAVARLLSGIPVGTVLGLLATGWIIAHWGWPSAFTAFGVLGLALSVVWFRTVRDDPSTDPRVAAEERALLPKPTVRGDAAIPWRRLILRRAFVAIVVAHFATTWTLYVLLSWLPSYFRDVQHLSVGSAGLFSGAPWITNAVVTNLVGVLSDRALQRGVSPTKVRKVVQCGGLVAAMAFMLALRSVTSPTVALALVCGAAGAIGCSSCGFAPGIGDVGGRHGAVLYGVSNTVATLPGIVGVALTGWLVDVTGTYAAGFVVTAAVSALGALTFALLFDARPLADESVAAAAG